MPIDLNLPGADEIEISLFGPGTGECIVIHLGSGQWMIVDSCKPAKSTEPIALEYLRSLGLNPVECVSTILVSHFHADHIKGMDKIIEECHMAKVWISAALIEKEAIGFVEAYSLDSSIVDRNFPGTKELKKILHNIESVGHAAESRILHRSPTTTVTSLSPSDNAISQAKIDFAKLFEEAGKGYKKLAPKLTPNRCAVAMHIESTMGSILLGADLEKSGDVSLGWEAVLASATRPTEKAVFFKVPHHGSETGHLDSIYTELLEPDPIAILTTMNGSGLPSRDDVERIRAHASSIYCTTVPKEKIPKREKKVEQAIKPYVKSRRVVPGSCGHIQLRYSEGSIQINLNEHSTKL